MAKIKVEKTEARQNSGQLFVLKHNNKRVLVARPKTYELAISEARKRFPDLSHGNILLQTKQLEICDGHYVDLTSDIWESAIGLITLIEVVEGPASLAKDQVAAAAPLPVSPPVTPITDDGRIRVIFISSSGQQFPVIVNSSMIIYKAFRHVAKQLNVCEDDIYATYDGDRVSDYDTFTSRRVEYDDVIDIIMRQTGGKPVIYLYSPTEIDASVQLSLIPEWRFSVIYPVVPAISKQTRGQQIEWNVRTHQDGSLTETNTGLQVSYLFWEAETDSTIPPSPPSSPAFGQSQTAEHFSPSSSDLADADSVVLASSNVTPYLDKALDALGLHTEARTSFITYWLPAILKHKYVALRFVPQASYERAAPLQVTPQPDVVTRVFMLFRGVQEDKLGLEWPHAQARAEDDVAWWKGVVGVDLEKANDTNLFRVLEWGGMEVKR